MKKKRAGMFWTYGLQGVKGWAVEHKAGPIRIAGAVFLLVVLQIILIPMECVRILSQLFRIPRARYAEDKE